MNHFHLSCTNVLCIRRGQEGMTRSDWSDICHLLSSFVCSALIVSVCCEHVPGAALSQLSQPQTCHSYNLWPNYSQYQFSVLFLTFFLWHCGQKFHLIGTQGAKTKDVRRMMQCCPITKSVAFLSAVFCPVTLFVAVAESRLSVRISANFSQDGEICEQQQEDGQTTCPHWDSRARCSGLCKSAMTVLSLSLCRTLQHGVKVFLLCQSTELQNVLNTS